MKIYLSPSKSVRIFVLFVLFGIASGCATTEQSVDQETDKAITDQEKPEHLYNYSAIKRPVPHPIDKEIPWVFDNAVREGTRTNTGEPGPEYWVQRADYEIDVELVPSEKKVLGSSTITYHNNSPDTLNRIFLELAQNVHSEGVPRKGFAEVTGGIDLELVKIGDEELEEKRSAREAGYITSGTLLITTPTAPVLPGESVTIRTEWNFKVPQQGAGGRMGYSQGNLFFIAYWYPQVMVYDDVYGWFTDNFTTNAEFYHEFGDYSVNITVPDQWLVSATGKLKNAGEVLAKPILNRYEQSFTSDEVVRIVDTTDFGSVTSLSDKGKLTWKFRADNVRDFAFSVTKESIWDAARASVGDPNGDGQEDFIRVGAIYREQARHWKKAAEFSQHSVTFLSEFTDLSYPWPHMTAVEGAGIIGGGMEFPMMTVIGSYNWSETSNPLYYVIAHEIAHMWIPMIVSSNERRYSWMDEGTTTFNENQARKDYFKGTSPDQNEFNSYLNLAGSVLEGEIMRWSDYHYPGGFGVASYPKPASMLVSLRGLLGEETFMEAFHTFFDNWKYKHPYPWDLFNTFEEVSGEDLDWFWRSWYYETWILDQAVAGVEKSGNSTIITIEDRGQIPMPAEVKITYADGSSAIKNISVESWLNGAVTEKITVEGASEVTKVEIDPNFKFPDADRSNNTWKR